MKTYRQEVSFLLLVINLSTMLAANHSSCTLASKEHLVCNYIPATIPEGVLSVHVKDFMTGKVDYNIQADMFRSESWTPVQHLELSWTPVQHLELSNTLFQIHDGAFIRLENLKVLKIQLGNIIQLYPNSLTCLKALQSLDLSKCFRLSIDMVTAALNGSEKVPNLEDLNLSELQLYWAGIKIGEDFCQSLKDKPLRVLDLSGTHISNIEIVKLSYLKSLETLNVSFSTVDNINIDVVNNRHEDVRRLKVLDVRNIMTANFITPSLTKDIIIANVHWPFDDRVVVDYEPEVLNISGFIHKHTISIYNTKVWCPSKKKIWIEKAIGRDNNLRRLDIALNCSNCDFTALQQFDIAHNTLEYINPSLFSCIPNLIQLDLSSNRLYIMYNENIELFGQLLNSSEKLMTVNLASNNLTNLPEEFFRNNLELMSINLEGNRLTQVHFNLFHLKQLKVLDISNNDIKMFDSLSITRLDYLNIDIQSENVGLHELETMVEPFNKTTIRNIHVKVSGNPLICDSCMARSSITWLTKSNVISSNKLRCLGENGQMLNMNSAVKKVQEICNRVTKIVIVTVTSVAICSIVIATVLVILRRRKRAQRKSLRNDIIEMLRDDLEGFVVFLSFCSNDEEFVTENVIEPLNKGLQRIIGTERNLVCTGDRNFRVGQYVHAEYFRCLERASVFISIVSDDYNSSNYCADEFNQAFQANIPVLLMIKGNINEDLMSPTMNTTFRHRVRILWEENGDNFRLKTTWDNVCNSILDIAAN